MKILALSLSWNNSKNMILSRNYLCKLLMKVLLNNQLKIKKMISPKYLSIQKNKFLKKYSKLKKIFTHLYQKKERLSLFNLNNKINKNNKEINHLVKEVLGFKKQTLSMSKWKK